MLISRYCLIVLFVIKVGRNVQATLERQEIIALQNEQYFEGLALDRLQVM